MKFGYEDTDKKIGISIYDLEFEIKMISNDAERIKNVDKNTNDLEREIDNILGEGAVDKINAKREKDGYPKMDLKVELTLIGCIFEAYANAMGDSALNRVENSFKTINNRMNNFNKPKYRRNNNYRRY